MFDGLWSAVGDITGGVKNIATDVVGSLAGNAGNIASGLLQNQANKDQLKAQQAIADSQARQAAQTTRYLMIGGAVIAVAVLAFVVFRK